MKQREKSAIKPKFRGWEKKKERKERMLTEIKGIILSHVSLQVISKAKKL